MDRRVLARGIGLLVAGGLDRSGGNPMQSRGSARDGRRARETGESSPARQRLHGG